MFKNYSLKKLAGYLALLMVASFILSFIIFFNTGGIESLMAGTEGSDKTNVNIEKIANASGISNIDINTSSIDVAIIPEKREDIRALLIGYTTSPKPEFTVNQSGDTVNIRVRNESIIIGINIVNLKLEIHVPENYSKNIKVHTSSGDIKIGKLSVENFFYEGSSGDLTTDDLVVKKGSVDVSSGDVRMNNFTGDLTAQARSGNISVSYIAFNNNVDMDASSGDITLRLPADAQFQLKAKTSSGDIDSDFDITTSGDRDEDRLEGTVGISENHIVLHTSSGNIDIEK